MATFNSFDNLDFGLDDLQDLHLETNPLSLSTLSDFSALCVPNDSIDDIGWLLTTFPDHSFKPETYETSSPFDFPTTPEQEMETNPNKRGFPEDLCGVLHEENGPLRKKQRSKRTGRVWSSNVNALLPSKRRCGHCGTDTTPQWRMGPMGPKTLCNACGVRYKSGRLVPEYRPAASPTFDSRMHSNSHRKIVKMRMSSGDM